MIFCYFGVVDGLDELSYILQCKCSAVDESFEYLDAPTDRIAGADVQMPYAVNLELLAVPLLINNRWGHFPVGFSCQLPIQSCESFEEFEERFQQ